VEKIVKAYGGEIRAYNDNGACFEFTLKDHSSLGPRDLNIIHQDS
jgi:signal transduction histidine kinase